MTTSTRPRLLRLCWRQVSFADKPAGNALDEQDLEIAGSTKAKEPPKAISPFARSFGKQLSRLLFRGWKVRVVVRNLGSFFRFYLQFYLVSVSGLYF